VSEDGALPAAARAVGDAIRRHAEICQDEPGNVGAVVGAGEALCAAVLAYEKTLAAVSGWSNPIRHLGPLPLFADGAPRPGPAGADGGPTVQLTARYRLRVTDAADLTAFVSGRFGEEVADVRQAIRNLFEAEGWDPGRYPPGLLNVEKAEVDISAPSTDQT
jgi:hypothetical protein